MAGRFQSLVQACEAGKAWQEAVDEKVREANASIASISSPTNLLVMNAAHAGDAGKSFSVVADEIRRLSETAADQSRDIGAELAKIGATIGEVVEASAGSGDSFALMAADIEETARLVTETGRARDDGRQPAGAGVDEEAVQKGNHRGTESQSQSTEEEELAENDLGKNEYLYLL
jgi:methyl-accepting chemotaxis protein